MRFFDTIVRIALITIRNNSILTDADARLLDVPQPCRMSSLYHQ